MIDALLLPLGYDRIVLLMREGLLVTKGFTDTGAEIIVPAHDLDPATVIDAHKALMALDPDSVRERDRTYPTWRSQFRRDMKPEPIE